MADRVYTPEEQAMINARVPGIQWIGGRPYTTKTTTPEPGEVDYLGNPVEATSELVPASTKPDAFPWWALAGMVAAPAIAAGAGAGIGALSGGAGGGAGAAGATGALGSVPIGGTGALSTAGMLAPSAIGIGVPAAAGGATAAGGGGFLSALTGGGGKLGAGLKAAGTIGRIAGGAAEASAQNDLSRAGLDQNRARLQGDLFQTQQQAEMQGGNLDLQRKQFESSEEGTRLRRALIGQLLGNAQALDINLPGVPKAQVTGGLSVNSLGQGGRDTAALMTARALEQLAKGNQFQGGQILTPPTVPEVGRTGGNKFLNVLGTLGSMAGSFATNPGSR